tara:strand:- start:30 stop:332 length:303 start_codon:yes stop_codon:yes gene_type:complete
MNRVHQIQSAPAYITTFIQGNMEQLLTIYTEGINNFKVGCLMFLCSQETNKMDVQFMGDEQMCEILQQESWEGLKNNIPEDKKLFFVKDIDINSVFLIYI